MNEKGGFLREAIRNRRILGVAIVAVVVTVLAVVGSRLIGLSLLYTIPLLLALGGGTVLLRRWRARRRDSPPSASVVTVVAETVAVAGVLFVLIQLVPFGRMPSNPPVTGEPAWDNPQTRALAVRADPARCDHGA